MMHQPTYDILKGPCGYQHLNHLRLTALISCQRDVTALTSQLLLTLIELTSAHQTS